MDALKSVSVPRGTELIRQGDDVATCMYVVASGTLTCFVAADGKERVVSTVAKGDIVGELALLYNCARAASVRASYGDVELWELDRDTFNAIVKESSVRARERNEAFLSKVTLLSSLDAYDRSRIAESLRVETYGAGEHIIRVGDPGDRMFFVDEGICEASRVLEGDGPEEVVMEYRAGDFFGELAVIRNKVRQANVVAKTPVRVMALQTADFRRLCGTLEERMQANAKNYRGAVW